MILIEQEWKFLACTTCLQMQVLVVPQGLISQPSLIKAVAMGQYQYLILWGSYNP